MTTQQSNVAGLVQDLAHRLRMIQVDFADETAEERQEYLSEEIQRTLRSTVPDQREQMLADLGAQFPAWDNEVDVSLSSASKAGRSDLDERELADASFLVTRLIDAAREMEPGEKQVIRDRLVAGGVISPDQTLTWRDDAAETLQRVLEFQPSEDPDPQRALAAVDLLTDCLLALNKLSLRTWQEIAPKKKLMDRTKLARDLRLFMAGDPDVARDQIAADLEALRGVVASLIFAIKNAPREWAHRHLERFGVEAVMSAVNAEGVKFLDNREKRCWEKYRQLASNLDQVSLSKEILDEVAQFAKRIRESGRV